MWVNTEEVKVIEANQGNIRFIAYIAKWERDYSVWTIDTGRYCRKYYTYRAVITINGVIFNTYGKTEQKPNSIEYYSRKDNVMAKVTSIAKEITCLFKE